MLNYLYYKLYRASLKSSLKDVPHILAPVYFGGLISVNILVIYFFLVKINVLPFFLKDGKYGSFFTAVMIIISMIYYNKKRRTGIIEKYSSESEPKRKRGNAFVAIYVALTFLSIFAVAFYKPGKL